MANRKKHVYIVSLIIMLAVSLGSVVVGCSDNTNSTDTTSEITETDQQGSSALDESAPAGRPSEVADLNPDGSNHAGENLFYVVLDEQKSESAAQNSLSSMQESADEIDKAALTVITGEDTEGLSKDKYYIVEIYPSEEAIEGMGVISYAQTLAPKGFNPYVHQGTHQSTTPCVVVGVDVY